MRLLIVRLSALGDVVHALPALERLRAAAPGAHLTWATEPGQAPLLAGHPALDALVVVDRPRAGWAGPPRARALRTLRDGLARLRTARFDAALDLQGLLRSAALARAAGARRVLGPAWAREGASWLYDERLGAEPAGPRAHAVARTAGLVDAALGRLGLAAPSGPLAAGRVAPGLLAADLGALGPDGRVDERTEGAPWPGPGERVVVLPGAGKPANRPPPALLARVLDLLAARPAPGSTGAAPRALDLVGGPGDLALARAVARRCEVARPRVRCGQPLATTAALLRRADVVLGGDTGPLHLARLLGRPVVGLYFAADPARTGPHGLPQAAPALTLAGARAPALACAPCLDRRCRRWDGRRRCLDPLEPAAVAAAVVGLLPRAGPG